MEAVQNQSVHNTKSNSTVSCINETDTDELSKEKDELLFGVEEDGEDEDVLSDDSLRLRLSDDEDAEQEDITKNYTNISEFKSPNKNIEPSKDIITEENSSVDPQQVVEEAAKSVAEELTLKEAPNSEIKSNGRQKRKSAKNAEKMIRKKYLDSDSDSIDSDSDSEESIIASSYKLNQKISSASSVSLKRNCPDYEESVVFNGTVKKAKMNAKSEKVNTTKNITKLTFVEKFCQRNIKEKLPKLTQEQLEELLIQKIVETMTMRSEIGLLREQARLSEKNQESTRLKLQQLMKQVKDFEMVLNRNAADRRINPDKVVTPIKINRSVGLQVNFVTEHGMQNLRQIQQTSQQKIANTPTTSVSTPVSESNNSTASSSPRRGIKIRSPRRSEVSMTPSTPTISQSSTQTSPLISTVTPAALVVAKPLDTQQTLTLPSQTSTIQQILTGNMPQQQVQSQAYVLNGKISNQINRPNTALISAKSRNNDLIDLTDEEEKNKSAKISVASTPALIEQQLPTTVTTKPVQCFSRVIQTIPTNVAITTQAASIRLVQPNQSTPTATIVNGAPPRLAYVMQSSVGARQLLITSNANQQIRPITTCRVTTSFPTMTYKTGTSTIANGTVRVLTTPAVSNVQINKHPAPLPDTPNYGITPGWKLPPPAPSLKMTKVPNGIVLSWNMQLTDKYADIASYQLYAYQEVTGVTPSTSLWKKVGDVRALPLPMACTLTQFSEGNNYYFAVRAVDTHSRKGQYSIPGNISL
ncbi:Activating transcription factor 7-interacting protein 1 [Harpegnathos saltator]|uniref:Activating transcription factor 7-interacting protein 1 n=1 Tax=Harpegnathos saltator TaxID=610380 RepID=E2BKP5_HARSA|nr:Activating transcription factor 7-interacting protein 1 [Harpegnathos saltator]